MSTLFFHISIKEHFTSIVGSKRNIIYYRQSLQLRKLDLGFEGGQGGGGVATTNPSKLSLSQF
jgi:hypothetical protein